MNGRRGNRKLGVKRNMKLIKPNEISGKIMTLIEESDEYTILISPYVNLEKWYKLTKVINNAVKRGVNLQFCIRDDQHNLKSFEELDRFKYKYTPITNLHTKLYINEKYAIVTSMNLLFNSEINSHEIGYITETKEEHNELLEYCERYLELEVSEKFNNELLYLDWKQYVAQEVCAELGLNSITIYNEDEDQYKFNTGRNNYDYYIENGKENRFIMLGILSYKEYTAGLNKIREFEDETGLAIEFRDGQGSNYCTVRGEIKEKIHSTHIKYISKKDIRIIAEKLIKFIVKVDNFKEFISDYYFAIKENEKNYFNLLYTVSEYSSIQYKDCKKYRWCKGKIWPKFIFDFNYEQENYKEMIIEIKESIQRGEYPHVSLVRDCQENEELVKEFKSQGFSKVHEWACMCLGLADFEPKCKNPEDFRVVKVNNSDELKIWFEIVKQDLFNGKELEYHIFENIMNEKEIAFFIGYYKGTPVSTAMSYNQYKVSGIYMVATKNEYRKKGFGTAVTMHTLKFTKENGAKLATLQATALGKPMYEKIGFKEWFKHHFYTINE